MSILKLKNLRKNEDGFVLPLMIAIIFISAYLLLMLATQIEVRVDSYAQTRMYMTMNLLEKEGLEKLEHFLSTMEAMESFSDRWVLRNGAGMIINANKREDFFDFHYQIMYNRVVRSRSLSFSFEKGRLLSN